MDVKSPIDIVIPILYVLVFIALIWFIVELILTLRRTRSTVKDLHEKLEPSLENIEEISNSLKPIVNKVDPLVERISLTVDAANLEIMRVDQILEDVHEVTDSVSSAVSAVDTAANMPIELVSSLTSKMRHALSSKKASSESVSLGEKKAAEALSNKEAAPKQAGIRETAKQVLGQESASRGQNRRESGSDESKAARSNPGSSSHAADGDVSNIDAEAKPSQSGYYTYASPSDTSGEAR